MLLVRLWRWHLVAALRPARCLHVPSTIPLEVTVHVVNVPLSNRKLCSPSDCFVVVLARNITKMLGRFRLSRPKVAKGYAIIVQFVVHVLGTVPRLRSVDV